jgi:hypothetical protein
MLVRIQSIKYMINSEVHFVGYFYTGVPSCTLVIRSKTYRGYVKLRIIPKAIYKVIFM